MSALLAVRWFFFLEIFPIIFCTGSLMVRKFSSMELHGVWMVSCKLVSFFWFQLFFFSQGDQSYITMLLIPSLQATQASEFDQTPFHIDKKCVFLRFLISLYLVNQNFGNFILLSFEFCFLSRKWSFLFQRRPNSLLFTTNSEVFLSFAALSRLR